MSARLFKTDHKTAPTGGGLFAATGQRRRRRAVIGEGGEIVVTADTTRAKRDHYPTLDPHVTSALFVARPDLIARFRHVWEPAVGAGHMARELEAWGFAVTGSDIHDYGAGYLVEDYFSVGAAVARLQITNPPFNAANATADGRWIRHGLAIGCEVMALVLAAQWACTDGIARLLRDCPAAEVIELGWKPDFTGEGAPPVGMRWVVWDRCHAGPCRHQVVSQGAAKAARDGLGGRLL